MSKQLPWVRLYTRTVNDDKLKLLAFEDRWHFIALLCLKGEGLLDKGDAPSLLMRKVAVKLGLDVRSLEEVARRLAEVGLIDHPGGRSAGTQGARVSGTKYGNRRAVSADGLKFDSVAELHRWTHLCILQRAGLISDLRRQVVFELVRGVKFAGAARARPAIRYVAVFVYMEHGAEVIEDVKGVETPEFKLKRHLMLALLGREVRVVK